MRVIKLEIEVPTAMGRTQLLRQLVSLDRSKLRKVKDFIASVKKMCSLKGSYVISVDGFSIPNGDTSQIL